LDELVLVLEVEEEGVLDEVEILVLVYVDLYLLHRLEEGRQKTAIELLQMDSRFVLVAAVEHVHEIADGLTLSANLFIACLCLLFFY
jgi:hypothetical protein